MRDFMMAAVPLVVAGIALAVFFAGRAEKEKEGPGVPYRFPVHFHHGASFG